MGLPGVSELRARRPSALAGGAERTRRHHHLLRLTDVTSAPSTLHRPKRTADTEHCCQPHASSTVQSKTRPCFLHISHSTSSPNFLSTLELRVWCRWSSVFVSRTHYVTALYRLPTAKLSYSPRRFPSKPTRSYCRHTSSPGASPIGQRLAVNHRYS